MNEEHDSEEVNPSLQTRNPFLIVFGFTVLGFAVAFLLFGRALFDNSYDLPILEPPSNNENNAFTLPNNAIQVGNLAPDFILEDLEGNAVALSDFRGQPVIINFWATWCPPCRVEMPDLQTAYEDYQDEGLVILALDQAEPADLVTAFFYEEMNLTFTPLLDTNSTVSSLYRTFSYPTSYFVNADGNVTAIHRGLMSFGQIEDYLDQTIPN